MSGSGFRGFSEDFCESGCRGRCALPGWSLGASSGNDAGSNMVGASREAPDVPRYEEGIKQASEGVLMEEQDMRGK